MRIDIEPSLYLTSISWLHLKKYYRQKKDLTCQVEPCTVKSTLMYRKSVPKPDTAVLSCVQVKYNYQDVSA